MRRPEADPEGRANRRAGADAPAPESARPEGGSSQEDVSFAEVFRRVAGADPEVGGLEETLAALVERARAAWPALQLDGEALVAHLARRAPAAAADLAGYLQAVNIEDLALAFACSERDARAIHELEARHLARVPRALAHLGGDVSFDELLQGLRERFLVGANGQGKIADYSGRGSLAAWVRAAAMRAAIDALRDQKGRRRASSDELEALPAAVSDPEIDLLRARYAKEFQGALRAALEAMPRRDRNVLRFSYLDGLSIDEIAAFYRVHRATAARWIGRARAALVDETRRLVIEKVAIGEAELESLMRDLASQLEVSIRRLLG
jgi:RNA polymerase sigma-70 factor (ECF subfamily)